MNVKFRTHPVAAPASEPFAPPTDPSAWWAFASCLIGGLLLVHFKQPARLGEAGLLAASGAFFFLCSDWISSLSGKGYRGEIPHGNFLSLPGIALLSASLACLGWFYYLQPEYESRFWGLALASAAALNALMFIMRLEIVPLDARLLLLTSVLCTAPALMLGFLAFGEAREEAWLFWLPAALFFPVSAIFNHTWLRGLQSGRRPLGLLALPLLALWVGAVGSRAWVSALLIAAYIAYVLRRLLTRYESGGNQLPAFSDIRRLSLEQALWSATFAGLWLWQMLSR